MLLANEFDDLDDSLFDDLDDDMLDCVDDLVASAPPPQPTPIQAVQPPPKAQPQHAVQELEDDLDDFDVDFDDDLGGDIDLEAIEQAAMQSMKQLSSNAADVCQASDYGGMG